MRQRYHNATGSGELTGPSGAEPKARVTYTAMYYDEIGRPLATADYGTNGDSALARPATVPARSDDVLVTSTEYDETGMASRTIDPAGREHRQFFDALGRSVKTVENYVDGLVDAEHPDEDVTVERTYTPDGLLSTLTAKNPATGDQVTRYVYGTTLADSGVARRDLLRAEIYPDCDDTSDPLAHGPDEVYDRVEYRYNRQGEVVEKKDQNGTVHAYEYDLLGRRTADRAITLGAGVEGGVRRIETAYEVRGMVARLTSFDAADGGNPVNEVAFEYDDTGRLVREYQEHAGAKDAATLSVGYAYDPSADAGQFTKGLRPTSVRYPNGRLVHFTYGPPEGTNDALDRLAAIHDDDAGRPGQRLAEYTYLGLGTIVVEDYPQPQVKLDYTGEGSYRGFDRINRLVSAARADGFAQSWTLDALGNFRQFDDDGNLQTRTANPVNEITAITGGWITPSYDAAGNLTSGPKPGQEATRVHYRYDAWNRLVKVYADDSQNPGQPGDLVAQYVYDGTNRRVEKLVTQAGGDPRQVHYYYNHDWQLLEERFVDGQGVTVASNQYVWSVRYIDAPIIRFHDGNANGDLLDTGDNIRYYTGDGNFNATVTIDAATGGVVERYVYTAYGEATVYDSDWSNPAASTTDGPLYCGYFFDPETGLSHVRNRYYDSKLSTFISRDPLLFRGGINLYRYVRNNPVLLTDPSGLYEIEWEGSWTDGQKQKIENAMSAVKARADALINEINKYLDGLSPLRQELGNSLNGLKRVLQKVSAGIASEGENLELYHFATGNAEPFASTYPAGWYGINGFWSDGQIIFNDDARPTSWQTGSANELGGYLFHELTHVYGTEDDDSEGSLNNAHNIDDLWDNGLDRWPALGFLKRAAEKKCKCPPEPGLQRPGFPDPFGLPWIF